MTATSTLSSDKPRKGLPGAVSVLILIGAVALGGWFLWSFWNSLNIRGDGAVVATDEPPSVYRQNAWSDRMRVQAVNQMNQDDYVRPRPRNQGGGFEVKGNRTRLIIQRNNNNLRITAESMDPNFVSAEQRTLLALRARATNEDAVARHINLTPEQKTQLDAIPRGMAYTLDPETRKKIEDLFTAWEKAPEDQKKPAADALTALAREIESSAGQAAKDSIATRADQVSKILTPEQVKLFEAMGRGR